MTGTAMTYPSLTAFYAGLFALLYVALAFWVVAGRLRTQTLHGTGPSELLKRVRCHGNFVEYVPFALLLIALLEARGGSPAFIRTLLIVLLIARVAHPFGMLAPPNSPRQYICRGGGTVATTAIFIIAALSLILH